MNTYTTKEKLAALTLLGLARSLTTYAKLEDQEAATEAVLTLAATYARHGADYAVVAMLEYPDVEVKE